MICLNLKPPNRVPRVTLNDDFDFFDCSDYVTLDECLRHKKVKKEWDCWSYTNSTASQESDLDADMDMVKVRQLFTFKNLRCSVSLRYKLDSLA